MPSIGSSFFLSLRFDRFYAFNYGTKELTTLNLATNSRTVNTLQTGYQLGELTGDKKTVRIINSFFVVSLVRGNTRYYASVILTPAGGYLAFRFMPIGQDNRPRHYCTRSKCYFFVVSNQQDRTLVYNFQASYYLDYKSNTEDTISLSDEFNKDRKSLFHFYLLLKPDDRLLFYERVELDIPINSIIEPVRFPRRTLSSSPTRRPDCRSSPATRGT